MQEYKIEVTETLSRIVKIKASSRQEAIEKVREMHQQEKIVLGADDFVAADFREME